MCLFMVTFLVPADTCVSSPWSEDAIPIFQVLHFSLDCGVLLFSLQYLAACGILTKDQTQVLGSESMES